MRSIFTSCFTLSTLLLRSSVSAQSVTSNPTQEQSSALESTTLGVGQSLEVTIQKGFRVKGVGESVTAKVTQSIYSGERLTVASGSTIRGHISSIESADRRIHVARLLNGDITPPRRIAVTFDEIELADGTLEPLGSEASVGLPGLETSLYRDKANRSSLRQQIHSQVQDALKSPNKGQRFLEAVVTSLPYHPEYIDQGTVFDVVLNAPLTVPALTQASSSALHNATPQYLRLRLLTALSSQREASSQVLKAVIAEPYYNADHILEYPAGSLVYGSVVQSTKSRWFRRQGSLFFRFTSASLPDTSSRQEFSARIVGVQASRDQGVQVGREGDLKATYSRFSQIAAAASLIQPSLAIGDRSAEKTALLRAGSGSSGFGLLGAGAAQASAGTAIGFGYYGAAKLVFQAFIARGSDVSLPADTTLMVRVEQLKAVDKVAMVRP